MQRITIQGIKNDPWFRKNYVTVKYGDEEVNLDDVRAVFDEIEVGPSFPPHSLNTVQFMLEVTWCQSLAAFAHCGQLMMIKSQQTGCRIIS